MKTIIFAISLGLSLPVFSGEPDTIFSTGFEASYTVGGDITGLDALGGSIEIFLNGVSQTTVMSDGTYTSSDLIEAGQVFDVTIENNNCTVMNGSGLMPNNAVTDANIDCPLAFTTVYDIKQGISTGDVALQNMLVTVCKDNFGYNLQTVPNDVDYQGDDYSGVFVFDNTIDCTVLQVGDRVDINPATVNEFFDEIQLNDATYAIQSSNNPLPSPVITTTSALDVVGPHPLNAVLVEVQSLTVTALDVPNNDFTVNSTLAIGDRYYLTTPFPEVNETMTYIRGPLAYFFGVNKIRPRSAGDLGRSVKLVINEVDYDQPTEDTEEFIEIFNQGPGQADLSNISVLLVNDDGSVFFTQSLASVGTLDANKYLIIGDPNVINNLPSGTASITLPSNVPIQNSGPEGIALIDSANEILLDALSYEGEITSADVGFTNPVNLVEGTATLELDNSADGSLSRIPNGQDTNDAASDWLFTDFSTPGAPNITELPSGQLLINEVDYDQPMTDSDEFIELYNASALTIDLAEVNLVLINGSAGNGAGSEYNTILLSGSLAPGEYAVIGSSTVSVPNGVIKINFANADNNIQNGSPDAIALINNTDNTLIDSLSYEGSITDAVIPGFANPVNLVEGNATGAQDNNSTTGSIIRNPNGQDTGDDSADFSFSTMPTPGEANNL